MTRQTIAVYMGYCEAFDGDSWKTATNIGGSEIAMANLVEEIMKLSKASSSGNGGKSNLMPEASASEESGITRHGRAEPAHVVLFGCRFPGNKIDKNGVEWRNVAEMPEFFRTNVVDVFVIWRYVHVLASVPFVHKAKRIYVWVHDVIIHSAYNGVFMEGNGHYGNNAGWLIDNFSSRINGVMCQSPWHASQLKLMYPRLANKLIEMPNGVDSDLLNNINSSTGFAKIPNRFIWASHHDRNIENIIRMWPLILAKIPTATLTIFGDKTEKTKDAVENFEKSFTSSVKVYGKVDHLTLFEEMKKSDVWFYPTFFPETYCMTALEAQLAGCVCIAYGTASLKSTIGDRGYIFEIDEKSPPPDELVVEKLCEILSPQNTYHRELTRRAGCEWAKQQGWGQRAKKWLDIISS